MRVAVTGGTGFTGRRLVAELRRRGHEVTALVRLTPAPPEWSAGVRTIRGELADAKSLRDLLDGCHALVHVASLGFGQADLMVSAAEAAAVPRAVFFSSTSIYTRLPAASKPERLRAEERVRRSRLAWTILRPTMIYGDAGDRNLSRLIRFLARTPVMPLPGGGRALIQPVHVEDLGPAAVDALECGRTEGRQYELPGAGPGTLRELVEHVRAELGRRCAIMPVPLGPMAALAVLWHGLGLPPHIAPEQVRRLAEDKAFPYDAAREDWGYAPRHWRTGLTEEVRLLRKAGWIA